MLTFSYRARDARGELVQGHLEAADGGAAADALLARGLTPVHVSAQQAGEARKRARERIGHVSDEDIMFFSRQMHTLLRAGVPILQALAGLRDSATSPAFAKMLDGLRDSLDSGRELSHGLAATGVFSEFYVQMVRVGEATGRLEAIFMTLFNHLRFDKEMRARVKAALRYPSFVIIALAAAMVAINVLIIPTFADVFRNFNATLPLMTRVLIAISNGFVHYWWLLLLGATGLGFAAWTFVNSPGGRLLWDEGKLRLPVIGSTLRKAALARFARSFSLALSSGLPAIQAFSVVARVVDNAFLAEHIEAMRVGVERGESILRVASSSGVFTPVVLQMIAVGEESGAIDDLLLEVAEMYEREVDYEIDTLSARIEPLLIVALGAMVLVMALGIFLPIWDLSSAMLGKR